MVNFEIDDGFSNKVDHDEVIRRIGGCGHFQKLATFILIMAIMSGHFVVNNLAFFELMPSYEC